MNKQLLIPIVALIALILKQFTNIELSAEEVDVIIEAILAIMILTGFWMNPKKK